MSAFDNLRLGSLNASVLVNVVPFIIGVLFDVEVPLGRGSSLHGVNFLRQLIVILFVKGQSRVRMGRLRKESGGLCGQVSVDHRMELWPLRLGQWWSEV